MVDKKESEEYLAKKVKPIFSSLTETILRDRPKEPVR